MSVAVLNGLENYGGAEKWKSVRVKQEGRNPKEPLNTLERLCLSTGMGTLQNPPTGSGGAGGKGVTGAWLQLRRIK